MERNRFGKMTLIKGKSSDDYEKQRDDKKQANSKKEKNDIKSKQGWGIFVY